MGNEIAKKYDMQEEPAASGGLACLWKIYKATEKVTGNPVSIFVFSKEDLKHVDKALREQVFVILRRELKILQSMSSRKHPSVVQHIESFEESKKLLAFVTERVSCSLADAIGEGSTTLSPEAASAARRGFERYEVARGFFGLCEGLQFVHTIQRRLHLNLAPESIFLAPSGQFKLGGFGFSVDLPSDGSSSTPCPYFQTGARSGFEGMWRLHPVMAFSSPEATAPAGSSDVSCASDMFSLGCLMYQLCRDDLRAGRFITADASPQAHQTFCATLDYPGRVNVSTLYPEVQSLVASLVQASPMARPNLGNVTINPVFHTTEVTVLKTIDSIPGRNPAEAATFLTSIRPAVSGFPLRVQRDCITMPLMDACGADQSGRLWAFALPIITDVCEKLDRREIIASVQAKFGPALQAEPVEALASLVDAIPLFLKKTEVNFFRSDVVPMVCRALQAQGNPQIRESAAKAMNVQEAALKAVTDEGFHGAIDGKTRELSILPRVCWLVVKGTAVRVKVNALLCLSKTFHFYQVRAVVDKILPTLKFCAERDETVAIQLCVLGCYDAVAKRLERLGPVATHILPSCAPMLACKGLNSNQFEMAVGIVQGMLETVIAYRRREIANPSATAIIENRPTHAGGEPDEGEIAKQRLAKLGGWKAAPATPPPKSASKSPSAPSTGFPGKSSSLSPQRAAASSPGAIDMTDFFSAPLNASTSAQPSAFPSTLAPAQSGVAPISSLSGQISGGTEAFGGSGPAANMFEGLSMSQTKPTTNGTASAGLGSAFGSSTAQGSSNLSPLGGGLSWMDGAMGGGGGGDSSSISGTGGTRNSGSFLARGISPPPQPPRARALPAAVSGNAGGDPFSSFFDAAATGGPGPAGMPQMRSSPSPHPPGPAAGGGQSFEGVFGAAPSGSRVSGGSSSGAASGGGGGGTLEDQLAKTQMEIAQLTRELGGGGMPASAGIGAASAMGAAMRGAAGSGWGSPGASSAPMSGMNSGMSSGMSSGQGWPGPGGVGQPLAQQQGQTVEISQDPFAFLNSASQSGPGERQGRSSTNINFDLFG